jgi:hypothetical protein
LGSSRRSFAERRHCTTYCLSSTASPKSEYAIVFGALHVNGIVNLWHTQQCSAAGAVPVHGSSGRHDAALTGATCTSCIVEGSSGCPAAVAAVFSSSTCQQHRPAAAAVSPTSRSSVVPMSSSSDLHWHQI